MNSNGLLLKEAYKLKLATDDAVSGAVKLTTTAPLTETVGINLSTAPNTYIKVQDKKVEIIFSKYGSETTKNRPRHR